MEVKIYTDGACVGNPGPGGWAAVIIEENNTSHVVNAISPAFTASFALADNIVDNSTFF